MITKVGVVQLVARISGHVLYCSKDARSSFFSASSGRRSSRNYGSPGLISVWRNSTAKISPQCIPSLASQTLAKGEGLVTLLVVQRCRDFLAR